MIDSQMFKEPKLVSPKSSLWNVAIVCGLAGAQFDTLLQSANTF